MAIKKKTSRRKTAKKQVKGNEAKSRGFKSRRQGSLKKAQMSDNRRREIPGVKELRATKVANLDGLKANNVFGDKSQNQKYFSTSLTGPRQRQAASLCSLSSYMTSVGVNVHGDEFDPFDLYAMHIIDLLERQVYTVANLSKHEKFLLFRYFYKTNPILGRVIDLSTEIPLSKLRLRPPRGVPSIVKHYVLHFFEKMMERINFNERMRDYILQYLVYGETNGIVDDSYARQDQVLQRFEDVDESAFDVTDEEREKLKDIEDRYEQDSKTVSAQERREYLKLKFSPFFNPKYRGPDRMTIVKFYNIEEYFTNEDTGYEAIKIELSDELQSMLQGGSHSENSREALKELGYTDGYIDLIEETGDRRSIVVDNDNMSGDPFLFVYRRYDGISTTDRVLNSLLEWDAAKRSMRAKIRMLGKVGRIVVSEGLAEGQINALEAEIELMLEDPEYTIVANFPIDIHEINAFMKDELSDLADATDKVKAEISDGWGVPDSLISGDSQYSGDTIKVEILNSQFFNFKIRTENMFQDQLFKPIALRKGFVALDAWGEPTLIYPRLVFSALNLRSSDYFDLLFTMYQKGSLNVEVIYDLLNLDGEDVEQSLKENLWSLKNDTFNEVIRNVLNDAADGIVEKTNVREKIIENLSLVIKEQAEEEEEDSGSSRRRR